MHISRKVEQELGTTLTTKKDRKGLEVVEGSIHNIKIQFRDIWWVEIGPENNEENINMINHKHYCILLLRHEFFSTI